MIFTSILDIFCGAGNSYMLSLLLLIDVVHLILPFGETGWAEGVGWILEEWVRWRWGRGVGCGGSIPVPWDETTEYSSVVMTPNVPAGIGYHARGTNSIITGIHVNVRDSWRHALELLGKEQ